MRKTPNLRAEKYRVMTGIAGTGPDAGNNGAFYVPVGRVEVKVIVSDGEGWDHVSVSLANRCPTWEEMEAVRKLFFADDEVVVQFGVPASVHISDHPYCLHWWRSQEAPVSLPPAWMVGPGLGEEATRQAARSRETGLPPPNRIPKNLEGIAYFDVDRLNVATWCPEPDGQGPATQVHMTMEVEQLGLPLVTRFKGPDTLSQLIGALTRHLHDVWPGAVVPTG